MDRGGREWLHRLSLAIIGTCSVALIAYWVVVTASASVFPDLRGNAAILDPVDGLLGRTPAAYASSSGSPGDGSSVESSPPVPATVLDAKIGAVTTSAPPEGPHYTPQGRLRAFLGCADSTSAEDLDAFFAERRGPLLGWDNPHLIELGPERWLWLAHDLYLDYEGDAVGLKDSGPQIQNAAFEQLESCFFIEHRGTPTARSNFEVGDGRVPDDHHLWPLGSEVHDDKLFVFWGETATAQGDDRPPPGHGITRHPVATWLATYDVETLERLSFDPAPNPGVDPVYGFAVASDESHTYLFGNTNQLNLWREGGFANGPHSATRMFLARVPLGQLTSPPEYWDGGGWTADAVAAQPISERFWVENTMQPRYLDGQWISVVNEDGFFGLNVLLETADDPWGPWTTVEELEYEPRPSARAKNTYQPVIAPWSSSDDGVTIVISENAQNWNAAVEHPPMYRPSVFGLDWPTQGATGDESVAE